MGKQEIVPVSAADALRLSAGFTARDIALLVCVEQLGMATTEQLARAFFNSPRSAYNRLRLLSQHRFLARVAADPETIRIAVGTGGRRRRGSRDNQSDHLQISKTRSWNPAFSLDQNGYFLLTAHHGYRARNWHASTAGAVTSRFSHTIGVSEVWSYLVAAARATQELDPHMSPEDPWRYRLNVGFLTERQSMLTAKRAATAANASKSVGDSLSHSLDSGGPDGVAHTRGRSKALLRPDGALILAICELGWPDDDDVAHGVEERTTPEVRSCNVGNARWDPSLHSWQQALLPVAPPRAVMTAHETPGGTIYRSLLLEMETGSNHPGMLKDKVARYNWIVRNRKQAWNSVYGQSPRVLVVVQTDDQIEMQAQIWRSQYIVQAETAVLLTSLQTLSRVYDSAGSWMGSEVEVGMGMGAARRGRLSLMEQSCWLDVMALPAPSWKTLKHALHIGG